MQLVSGIRHGGLGSITVCVECQIVACNVCIVLLSVVLFDYNYWCMPRSGVGFIYLLPTYCVL